VRSADDIKKFKIKIFDVLEEECLLAVRNIEELKVSRLSRRQLDDVLKLIKQVTLFNCVIFAPDEGEPIFKNNTKASNKRKVSKN